MLLKEESYRPNNNAHEQNLSSFLENDIQQHYTERLSNDSLAQVSGYSYSYQNRIFKQQYGLTPFRFKK